MEDPVRQAKSLDFILGPMGSQLRVQEESMPRFAYVLLKMDLRWK